MAIEVAKIELKTVQDASGLDACIARGQFSADEVIAVIGKTEGNGGVGFGVSARPAGAWVIKDGEARWRPALDLNRVILVGQLVAIVALLTVRSIAKALAKRKQ